MNNSDTSSSTNSDTTTTTSSTTSHSDFRYRIGDPVVLGLSVGFILLFLGMSFYDISMVASLVNEGFAWTAGAMGSFFQLLLLLTFFIGLGVAISPAGAAKIGGLKKPELSTFKWLSIIMCTLLAGGGVFFAAGEPVYHFLDTPPAFSTEAGTAEAISGALAQSFMHWGFLAWGILGTLSAIVLSYAHYVKKQPLQPRTLLYPVLGERLMKSWVGGLVDAFCVIAVVAGTVGPIGFLATQVSYGFSDLFGTADGLTAQFTVLIALALIYVSSAITGIHKGIQILSRFNVFLALAIASVIFIFGPTLFLTNAYTQGLGEYLSSFFTMSTMTSTTADPVWMQYWTVFFFAWFIGYGPLMALFVARISRGRTIRQMILAVAVMAPVATTIWFTLLGGSGIYYQYTEAIDLTEALMGFEFAVATLTIAQALPGGALMGVAILLLTTIFVATTGDSMSYSIAVVCTGHDQPRTFIRAFWGIAMALMAGVLLYMGAGQINALQEFIVITAIPVSLILVSSLWLGPKAAYAMARSQGIIDKD